MTDAGTTGYALAEYAFRRPPEFGSDDPPVHPVAVVGGGLAGLSLVADLGLRGVPAVLLDQDSSSGAWGTASRGIAYAKRTLEIFDRLGIADRVRAKGVTWNEGRIYDGLDEIHHFVIQPERNQKWPAFVNLQQFYVEEYLAERIEQLGTADLRWQSRVVGVEPGEEAVTLHVDTPIGPYRVKASWVAACDGANSALRSYLGIATETALFEDYWAITDVRADLGDLQRRFWLNDPHLEQGAAIMHSMADGIVRCDWQIIQLDPDEEVTPERVRERLAAFLGEGIEFEVVTIGRFRFKRRIMERFGHGRVIFLGDAAHEIPPFGARGGNGGIQDAENLAWKLAAVVQGRASAELLSTYDAERVQAALENARAACRSASFITPKSVGEKLFRNAVLALAREHEFARALVDTGRPSAASRYTSTTLNVEDEDGFAGGLAAGEAAFSSLVEGPAGKDSAGSGHLLDWWRGNFTALYFVDEWASPPLPSEVAGFPLDHVVVTRRGEPAAGETTVLVDATGDLFDRYDAHEGACYVLRPDAHVAGRRRDPSPQRAAEIVARALEQAGAVSTAGIAR